MKSYNVTVAHKYYALESLTVEANSEEEAKEIALDASDPFCVSPGENGDYSDESEVIECEECD